MVYSQIVNYNFIYFDVDKYSEQKYLKLQYVLLDFCNCCLEIVSCQLPGLRGRDTSHWRKIISKLISVCLPSKLNTLYIIQQILFILSQEWGWRGGREVSDQLYNCDYKTSELHILVIDGTDLFFLAFGFASPGCDVTVHLTVLYPLFLYSGEIWNIWKLFPKCLPYGAQMKVSRYVYLEIQRLLAALIQHSAVAAPIPKLSQGRTIRFTWTS